MVEWVVGAVVVVLLLPLLMDFPPQEPSSSDFSSRRSVMATNGRRDCLPLLLPSPDALAPPRPMPSITRW